MCEKPVRAGAGVGMGGERVGGKRRFDVLVEAPLGKDIESPLIKQIKEF